MGAVERGKVAVCSANVWHLCSARVVQGQEALEPGSNGRCIAVAN